MANDLMSFLAENPVNEIIQEVKIPGRLKDFAFKIKPMTSKQFYSYQKVATKIGKDKTVNFDSGKFNELVVLNHVIEPNLRNTEVLAGLGVNTPEECLNKFFLCGELIDLSEKISEISGFSKTDTELEEEVKNS